MIQNPEVGKRLPGLIVKRYGRVGTTRARTMLAAEVGVSVNALVHIERGRAEPRASTLYGLCLALGVSADYLLGLTEDPTPRWDEEGQDADS